MSEIYREDRVYGSHSSINIVQLYRLHYVVEYKCVCRHRSIRVTVHVLGGERRVRASVCSCLHGVAQCSTALLVKLNNTLWEKSTESS